MPLPSKRVCHTILCGNSPVCGSLISSAVDASFDPYFQLYTYVTITDIDLLSRFVVYDHTSSLRYQNYDIFNDSSDLI